MSTDFSTRALSLGQLRRLDAVGATLSTLCAIHCAVVPLLVPFLSAVGLTAVASERLELAMISFAGLFAIASAWSGYRTHQHKPILLAFGLAATAIAAGYVIGEHAVVGRVLVILGALGLASAHLLNRRHCRCCAR